MLIHAFSNGNGKHTPLMTDLLLRNHGKERFTWASFMLESDTHATAQDARCNYIDALRQDDPHDMRALLTFVRS